MPHSRVRRAAAVGKQRGIAKQLAAVVDYAVAVADEHGSPSSGFAQAVAVEIPASLFWCKQRALILPRRHGFNAVAIQIEYHRSDNMVFAFHGSLSKSPKSLANGINQSPKSFWPDPHQSPGLVEFL